MNNITNELHIKAISNMIEQFFNGLHQHDDVIVHKYISEYKNECNSYHKTPLFFCLDHELLDYFQLLLKHKANVYHIDIATGLNILHQACKDNKIEYIKLILEYIKRKKKIIQKMIHILT